MDRETLVEVGLVGLAVIVVSGIAIMLGGGLAEGLLHRSRLREAAPEVGEIDPQRHHHILAPAAH